ncbi:MAG TPA: hypothetical protein VGO51_09745 [Burkholderiaceae bacterium]|jgi:hypothetical protein|nr:hypothetical protein [Burkholderiaceae bacterium]
MSATTISTHFPSGKPFAKTLFAFVSMLFMVNLRESLDVATTAKESDAAWAWGL